MYTRMCVFMILYLKCIYYLFTWYILMNDNLFFPQFDFEKMLTICAKQQLLEMHLINYSKTTFDL